MEENKFSEMENKWLKFWEEHPDFFRAKDDSERPKKYVLVEFPYPSGSGLHIGHTFSFTGGDVYARFKRMQGYNVLFPMGWDAFGLPTENYAIKVKRSPQEITKENTDSFRAQMKKLAFSFDWSREVNTTDPKYYKWTQWIFIQLFKKGLAYKEEMPINWCPSCKIGLANEEVVNGNCERCGAQVERRRISQWVVKITAYADKLIEGLKKTAFIDKVKSAQINWIDRKEWIDITYRVEGAGEAVTVATTRPETNFGATFVVLAPEHELAGKLIRGEIKTGEDVEKIKEYVRMAKNKSDRERQQEVVGRDKTGVFTGLYAINPLTEKRMPIWVTDFVLATVGTGAVVGVPGHDVRDFEFASQFKLPIVRVICGKDGENGEVTNKEQVWEGEGRVVNSGFLNGMESGEAKEKIMAYLEEKAIGKRSIRYHLRDWIFSRQHYWGEPIPMVYCRNCGWQPVEEKDLPVRLPEVEAYEPTDTGESPLAKMTEWVKTKCPKCGQDGARETDTMPNWAGSDWYYMRYIDPDNDTEIANYGKMKKWLPVDVYIGGDEHNTLHLLYSRFIYKFLADLGVVPTEEPYFRRMSHGVILGPDGQRMSKSRGNVVVPESVYEKYGVDVTRLYLMFMGPFEATMAWNEKTLAGVRRFIERYRQMVKRAIEGSKQNKLKHASNKELGMIINKTINKVEKDLENFGFNTAIAKLMEMVNEIGVEAKTAGEEEVGQLIKLIAPFAPYTAEDLWQEAKEDTWLESVHLSSWPKIEAGGGEEEEICVPVAVNGKVRSQLKVSKEDLGMREKVLMMAKAEEKVKAWLGGKPVIKEVYVPGKMVNLVI